MYLESMLGMVFNEVVTNEDKTLLEFKNEKGESVRKDAKFDKQYLEGKYGADPYLRRIIDWGKVNA